MVRRSDSDTPNRCPHNHGVSKARRRGNGEKGKALKGYSCLIAAAATAHQRLSRKEVPGITSYDSDAAPRSRTGFMHNPCLTSLIMRRTETLPQQICSRGNERKRLLLQALWVLLALTVRLSLRDTESAHGSANGNSWTGVSGIRRSTALAFSRCREIARAWYKRSDS